MTTTVTSSKGCWSSFTSSGSSEKQDRDPGALHPCCCPHQPPGRSHPSTKPQIEGKEERLARHRTVQSGSPLWPPQGCLAEFGNPCTWGTVGPEGSSLLTKRTDFFLLALHSRHSDPAPRSGHASRTHGSVAANPTLLPCAWHFLFPTCSQLTVSPTSLTSRKPSSAPEPSPAKMNGQTLREGGRRKSKQKYKINKGISLSRTWMTLHVMFEF